MAKIILSEWNILSETENPYYKCCRIHLSAFILIKNSKGYHQKAILEAHTILEKWQQRHKKNKKWGKNSKYTRKKFN